MDQPIDEYERHAADPHAVCIARSCARHKALAAHRLKLGIVFSFVACGLRRLYLQPLQSEHGHADFTLTFRRLCDSAEGDDAGIRALFKDSLDPWLLKWKDRLRQETILPSNYAAAMRAVNPAFIPRNHRIEAAISAAQENGNFAPFEQLLAVLAAPYQDQSALAHYAEPPRPDEVVMQTFCGT